MSSSISLYPTTSEFLNKLGSSVLSGGASTTARTTITTAAGLQNAIASQVLGLGSQTSANASTDGLSPFLSDITDSGALKNAITSSVLGGNESGQSVQSLAALGATLNKMAQLAQSALTANSATARGTALSNFTQLYDTLDQSSASIDGAAGNAASLGLSAPGDWTNSTTGTAAITQDMTSVVKAHTVVQEMIQSVGPTLIQSYLLG